MHGTIKFYCNTHVLKKILIVNIIALGDTHGRDLWQEIAKKEDYDKFIFIGDYLDSRENITTRFQIENFERILDFKRNDPERVVVLIGNHDYHYFDFVNEHYSGFQSNYKKEISRLLNDAIEERLMQICFLHEKYLFSHAGVTNTWYKKNVGTDKQLETRINNLLYNSPESFSFTIGENCSPFGDDKTQSPIWVRPDSLINDRLDGYIQVVGHTIQRTITTLNDVVFIDTLGTSQEYFTLKKNKIELIYFQESVTLLNSLQ